MSFRRFIRRFRRNLPPMPEVPSLRHIRHNIQRTIPPPPKISLAKTWRWIKARRRRKKFLVRFALILLCAVVLRFAGPPVKHVIKDWQARRLSRQAMALIEKDDWAMAGRKITGAFRLSF